MTNGTSQGLFIVVAIVIFGIFVLMAYILFEDNLSPALANMFTNATETAQERLRNSEPIEESHTKSNLENIEDTTSHPTEWFFPDVQFTNGSNVVVESYYFQHNTLWGKNESGATIILGTDYSYMFASQDAYHYTEENFELRHLGNLKVVDLDGISKIRVSKSRDGVEPFILQYEKEFSGDTVTNQDVELAYYDQNTPSNELNTHYIIEVWDTQGNNEKVETSVKLKPNITE